MVGVMTDRNYRLIVEGDLSDDLDAAVHGMLLTRAEGNTTLTGTGRSQSDIQGLLPCWPGACERRITTTRGPRRPGDELGQDGPRGAIRDGDGSRLPVPPTSFGR